MIQFSFKRSLIFGFLALSLFSFSQKIKVNQIAPVFTVIDSKKDTIRLENYKGKKVFLAFFRYASCPVCNFRMNEIIQNYNAIQAKGYEFIAVFESNNETLQQYLLETEVPFPIIGDPELILYKKYAVEKSFWRMVGSMFNKKTKSNLKEGKVLVKGKNLKRDGNMSRIPADFIIDENGIIIIAYYGTNIGDHLPLEQILNK
jgi:thioredoxin-dependent peroxiredoxin